MSLRVLTSTERSAALAKAAAARQVRARLKEALKSGELTVPQVLAQAEEDPAIARLKVSELLESFPGIGRVRSQAIMTQLRIAPSRRVRGLGVHQRKALIDFLEDK
ncbi:integration host factor, actinobacterial type [Arthrobacter sp. RAF14]|uniref:integration host factor, actinobacterial type n=1 Tax=Arthrobacter sp. RAF14 TaxID=3233051 RepID=UPI003F8F213A